jgi:flavodoxin
MGGSHDLGRRTFLLGTAAAAASMTLACSRTSQPASGLLATETNAKARDAGQKVLLVFFSRAGENYFDGGRKVLAVGNTEVVANMIRDALRCDVFQIQPADPYSDRYEPTVQRNVREQNENARPGIVNLPVSIDAYDTVLIGSPIWNVRVPRIILTFAERFDFAGKTIHPFTTHAMSGLGHAVEEYTAACPGATIGGALAIRGEDVESSRPDVEAWLRRLRLLG